MGKGGGVFPIYYNITIGGVGSTETPNLYYVIYGRPLIGQGYSEDLSNVILWDASDLPLAPWDTPNALLDPLGPPGH